MAGSAGFQLAFDAVEGFLTENMLHLAGVGGSSLLTNAQLHEKPGQQLVALIDLSGDGLSVGQQGDVTVEPISIRIYVK